ncbi:hypothetical protein L596_014887 [Steinernema carpocapsae]|uniref:Aminotransferase class I/classII large domain-containing protein n=1 Tax=Steinernema carpocapsae TaxID=34508 RepID=A0A4V6A2W7_STECR|nr:hypothetical protein L596_014887 [Steinernema carpocapsae]
MSRPEDFVTLFEGPMTTKYMFNVGAPPVFALKKAGELFDAASKQRMAEEVNDSARLLQYGAPVGDPRLIRALKKFLEEQYRDSVDEKFLVSTGGATSGLLFQMTQMFPDKCTVYCENLTYFLAVDILKNLHFKTMPVPMKPDGLDLEYLERVWEAELGSKTSNREPNKYNACLYIVPHYQNPTGIVYSPEVCCKLVTLARKYRVLVFCDDVYNILHYEQQPHKRLFAYDDPNDPEYNGGHVLSNGTFAKLLAPGFRLGWMELPLELKKKCWSNSMLLKSSGSLNTVMGGVVALMLEDGSASNLVSEIREDNKVKMASLLKILSEELPSDVTVTHQAQGGYFIYIQLPDRIDAKEFASFINKKYGIAVQEGFKFWSGEESDSERAKFINGIRLSVGYVSQRDVEDGSRLFCEGLKQFPSKI